MCILHLVAILALASVPIDFGDVPLAFARRIGSMNRAAPWILPSGKATHEAVLRADASPSFLPA